MRSRGVTAAACFCMIILAWGNLAFATPPLANAARYRAKEAVSQHLVRKIPEGLVVSVDDLDRIVQPITTITEFPDGKREVNLGSGFVVGRQYFTVQHNLAYHSPLVSAKTTSYLDGMRLTPSYVNVEQDVAVFELPIALCTRYCNDLSFGVMPELTRDRKVYWLRKFKGEHAVKEARMLNVALMGEVRGSPDAHAMGWCHSNLVVEVDTPFIGGSSGAPVLDSTTGQIIGIIQGSLESEGVKSGYFKPIDCVLSLVGDRGV
jgi:hypothetical protein